MSKLTTILTSLCALTSGFHCQAQLLAEVNTSAGSFSIDLKHTTARRTVAHFMRLASGQQPWLNHATGTVHQGTGFYNGMKFHKKVDQNQVPPVQRYIQTGSKNGTDNFSPGYVLRDEIRTSPFNGSYHVPHTAYTVSMANIIQSGITEPHSASSQFLITLVQDNSLNGKNSAFGNVNQIFTHYSPTGQPLGTSNGRAVVNTIFNNPAAVTISSISFRRIGAAATQFDETQLWGEIPLLGNPGITSYSHSPTEFTIGHPNFAGTSFHLYSSTDLTTWTHQPFATKFSPVIPSGPPQLSILHGGATMAFFKLRGATYPQIATPNNLYGKTIFVGKQTLESIFFAFDVNGINPNYTLPGQNPQPLQYTFTQLGAFHGDLHVTNPELGETIYRLYFGGTAENFTTDEEMSAIIFRPFESPVESHFLMNTP